MIKRSIILLITVTISLFLGCSQEKKEELLPLAKPLFETLPHTYLKKSSFHELEGYNEESFEELQRLFLNNCRSKKSQKLYGDLCKKAKYSIDAKEFFLQNFTPYRVYTKEMKGEGLLTGYYEPQLYGSKTKTKKYRYPIYETPKDLIVVDLSSIYPELKKYRLRGRIEGNRVVPYDTRAQSKRKNVPANVICYCDSKVDRFFLEIQGSGRVRLDDGDSIFVGYANQNGHRYRAIGRYLVKIGALKMEEVSLQSIRKWLEEHPKRVDEVLNYNRSLVYFKERQQGATGALGLELTPNRSVAVDRRYIPLGSMLYIDATVDDKKFRHALFAQDTGGAIKGAVRADLFLGSGKAALSIAGRLKSPLKIWIFLPKSMEESYR